MGSAEGESQALLRRPIRARPIGAPAALTEDTELREEADGRVGGHLALVDALVPPLQVADVQLPVLGGREREGRFADDRARLSTRLGGVCLSLCPGTYLFSCLSGWGLCICLLELSIYLFGSILVYLFLQGPYLSI